MEGKPSSQLQNWHKANQAKCNTIAFAQVKICSDINNAQAASISNLMHLTVFCTEVQLWSVTDNYMEKIFVPMVAVNFLLHLWPKIPA